MLGHAIAPGKCPCCQTSRVGLALAFSWVQSIAGKLTACHGLQKNPVQCNTVGKGVGTWAAANTAAIVVAQHTVVDLLHLGVPPRPA